MSALAPPRFESLPGLTAERTPEGGRYLRLGQGPQALVLLNAFGMPLDVWQALAAQLQPHCKVLVVDAAAHLPVSGLPQAYYDTPDALDRFEAAWRAVLQAEGLVYCHLVGWCAGAKYALELARRAPHHVAGVVLLAPSFAGEASDDGGDTSFEANLQVMCKLVNRQPQSATTMARSMLALLSKDDASTDEAVIDAAIRSWQHAPFVSADHMVSYSRQLMHFRAHRATVGGPLGAPLLLVTGERDRSTCAKRAAWLCQRLGTLRHVALQAGEHYFIHQHPEIIAQLIVSFMHDGLALRVMSAGLQEVATALPDPADALVTGAI